MGTLQADTALRREGGALTAELSRAWEIWGPNGGYVSAIALRAAGAVAPKDHRPATLSVQYISVARFAPIAAEAVLVKQGRNACLVNVSLTQEGRAFLQAQVWTTNKADGPAVAEAAMPHVPPPQDLRPIQDYLPPDAPRPAFWANFDTRPVRWTEPGQPNPDGGLQRNWYRFVDFDAGGDVYADQSRAVVLIDTLIWPTHWRAVAPSPSYIAPSLDLTVWFHEAAGPADWLLAETRADVAGGGLIHGRTRLWTADGRLVATGGSQLIHVAGR